jgi:serine/threonine-protein kinase
MGLVFQAEDRNTGQTVALKVIHLRQAASQAMRVRFVQEAQAARHLQHPHIVAIHDFGQSRGLLFIAMEYLDGDPLSTFIPGTPELSIASRLSIVAECAEALAYAHRQGVVHRDVKPANIMVLKDHSSKLVDFGLAGWMRLPDAAVHGGTPPYMSPEQIQSRPVDGRTDIWALGITLFELLTGRLPYRSRNEILSAPAPTLPADFPYADRLNAVLARALAKDPDTRYADAGQFAADVRALSQTAEPSATSGAPKAAQTSTGGRTLRELGFACPAAGPVHARAGRLLWRDRALTLRDLRDRYLPAWFLRLAVFAGAAWLVAVRLMPRISPDARAPLMIAGAVGVCTGVLALFAVAWLAVTGCIRVCPIAGGPEGAPICRRCGSPMGRARVWSRVCSSREEVFFGYRDCMAALKSRLWVEAATLISIYGEEEFSEYREGFISGGIRYHAAFFECVPCAHHAARLTTEELVHKHWEENPKYEEVYWGEGGAGPSAPVHSIGLRPYLTLLPAAIRKLLSAAGERPVWTFAAVLTALVVPAFAWIAWRTPPVSRAISRVAWSPDGRWLAAATSGWKTEVWDLSTGATRRVNFGPGAVRDLQFSPDGRSLAIASRNLWILPAPSSAPKTLRRDFQHYRSVRWSPDGRTLAITTGLGLIETIDAGSGALRWAACCSAIYDDPGEVAFTPRGDAVVNAGLWPGLWNASTGRFLGRLPTDRVARSFGPIGFYPRFGSIFMGSSTGAVWAWDAESRGLAGGTQAPIAWYLRGPVDTLAVTQNGAVLFAGHRVGVWDLEAGHTGSWADARPKSNLALSPDGGTLVFGTTEGHVEFWDVRTAGRVRTLRFPD